MRIYLDNNATTQIHPAILSPLMDGMRDVFGNASSVHAEGQRARGALEEAREAVAALIRADPKEIVFTSGGSESNNAALLGLIGERAPAHIVCSSIEHPSVLRPVEHLRTAGHRVTFVACESSGRVDASRMIAAIEQDTRLVTLMLANNETGVLQPVEEIGAFCRSRGIHFHCDAVQAAGKIAADVSMLAVDTLAISGHKYHAPKGVGALYVRRGVVLEPQMLGGAQERRRRAGTENVPLASAMGLASSIAGEDSGSAAVAALRDEFEQLLLKEFPWAVIAGGEVPRLPNTSNVNFPQHDAEGIVIGLDLAGIAVSTGSACSSGRVEPSHVLLAMGLSEEDARSSVRFSLSRFNRLEEIRQVVVVLQQLVPKTLRR